MSIHRASIQPMTDPALHTAEVYKARMPGLKHFWTSNSGFTPTAWTDIIGGVICRPSQAAIDAEQPFVLDTDGGVLATYSSNGPDEFNLSPAAPVAGETYILLGVRKATSTAASIQLGGDGTIDNSMRAHSGANHRWRQDSLNSWVGPSSGFTVVALDIVGAALTLDPAAGGTVGQALARVSASSAATFAATPAGTLTGAGSTWTGITTGPLAANMSVLGTLVTTNSGLRGVAVLRGSAATLPTLENLKRGLLWMAADGGNRLYPGWFSA